MHANQYTLVITATYITGKANVVGTPLSFVSLDDAKAFIADVQMKRSEWDNDGFVRKVDYVVRYGNAVNGWDARQYVCTFAFDDCFRSYATAYERIVPVVCTCMSDKDHSRNTRDALCY